MLPLERHRLILQLLGQQGVMRVNDIAAHPAFPVKRCAVTSANCSAEGCSAAVMAAHW
ncbi:Uncharacterised protein [Cedecea neteri]|uniref:Uncharacterized protein n=1 Tax=Cedecea neteri TaxID=158822 RepID=A0A2X2T9Y6_9ENTR|nr:Uncharacterised protein [Cedecea neteri]